MEFVKNQTKTIKIKKMYVKKQIILLKIIALNNCYALFNIEDKKDYIGQNGIFKNLFRGNIIKIGTQNDYMRC